MYCNEQEFQWTRSYKLLNNQPDVNAKDANFRNWSPHTHCFCASRHAQGDTTTTSNCPALTPLNIFERSTLTGQMHYEAFHFPPTQTLLLYTQIPKEDSRNRTLQVPNSTFTTAIVFTIAQAPPCPSPRSLTS